MGHEYVYLLGFSHMVQKINPRTINTIRCYTKDARFMYYIGYGSCIREYYHMQILIIIDDTHLNGKYEGVIFHVFAQDIEKHNFSIFLHDRQEIR